MFIAALDLVPVGGTLAENAATTSKFGRTGTARLHVVVMPDDKINAHLTGTWVTAGLLVFGNGSRMQFPVPADASAAFFCVADSYDSGTLYVTANTNTAGFALDPARGISPTNWGAQPDADRAVVGLSPGTYTVTFDAVPRSAALPPQTVTVARGNISQVTADFALPMN